MLKAAGQSRLHSLPGAWPLTLSVPVVVLNSPNLSPYFSLNKFERIWLLIFSSWLCLINSHFLITKCYILYVLYKEKLVVDNWLALKGLMKTLIAPLLSVNVFILQSVLSSNKFYFVYLGRRLNKNKILCQMLISKLDELVIKGAARGVGR